MEEEILDSVDKNNEYIFRLKWRPIIIWTTIYLIGIFFKWRQYPGSRFILLISSSGLSAYLFHAALSAKLSLGKIKTLGVLLISFPILLVLQALLFEFIHVYYFAGYFVFSVVFLLYFLGYYLFHHFRKKKGKSLSELT